MSLRIVLIAAGVIALLFGAYFLLWADQAIQSFELGASDVASRLFGRSLGVALISLGVVNLLSSSDVGSAALRAVVVGNIVVHVLAPLVDLTESFPWTAGRWVGLAIHVVLFLAFGYYLLNWQKVAKA